jgi:hypothetical protein
MEITDNFLSDHINWKTHIEEISHKLDVVCFTIRNLTLILNADVLRLVCFAYFHPLLQYGIILGGNSAHVQHVFKVQKKISQGNVWNSANVLM